MSRKQFQLPLVPDTLQIFIPATSGHLLGEEQISEQVKISKKCELTVSQPACPEIDEKRDEEILENVENMVLCVSQVLRRKIYDSRHVKKKGNLFSCKVVPRHSIEQYLRRIARLSQCKSYILVLALIYIDRYTTANQELNLSAKNVHKFIILYLRLLLTAVFIANKYYDDQFMLKSNRMFAGVGGIQLSLLNALEKEFLVRVKYELYVSRETEEKYLRDLQATLEKLKERICEKQGEPKPELSHLRA